jgi:hypothetical protein
MWGVFKALREKREQGVHEQNNVKYYFALLPVAV